MSDQIEVFPSVGSVTLEVDSTSVFIRQADDYQQSIDAVEIPRVFLPVFATELFRHLGSEELRSLKRLICVAQREADGRG